MRFLRAEIHVEIAWNGCVGRMVYFGAGIDDAGK
jgi:hypothetical protein